MTKVKTMELSSDPRWAPPPPLNEEICRDGCWAQMSGCRGGQMTRGSVVVLPKCVVCPLNTSVAYVHNSYLVLVFRHQEIRKIPVRLMRKVGLSIWIKIRSFYNTNLNS